MNDGINYGSSKQFLLNQLSWIGIYIAIGFILSLILPFPTSLIAALGMFILITFYRTRKIMKRVGSQSKGFFGSCSSMFGHGRIGWPSGIINYYFMLYITSVPKGLVTGVIAGVIVWTVLFIPINALVVQPELQNIIDTQSPNSPDNFMASQLLKLSDTIIYGSLALDIVFGAVMGFCA